MSHYFRIRGNEKQVTEAKKFVRHLLNMGKKGMMLTGRSNEIKVIDYVKFYM